MNWLVLILLGIGAFALIVFLVWRNRKDQQNLEKQLNNDYPKSKDMEGESPMDETMK